MVVSKYRNKTNMTMENQENILNTDTYVYWESTIKTTLKTAKEVKTSKLDRVDIEV